MILVISGAVPGTILRYLIGNFLSPINGIPISTILINLTGSFLLGIIVTLFQLRIIDSTYITLIGIGFCGSLTTMSSFAYETITILNQSLILSVGYLTLMLGVVFFSAYIGRLSVYFIYLGETDK